MVALTVAGVAFQFIRPAVPSSAARLTPDEPVFLVDQLADELPDECCARILNEQVWGGYLAYRLKDRLLVAMDGRLEIRGAATWAAYFDLLHGEGDPVMTLDRGTGRAIVRRPSEVGLRDLYRAGNSPRCSFTVAST